MQNRGKNEAIKTEIKENVQGTKSEGKETRTQINGLNQKEEINIQPEQNEETRIQTKQNNNNNNNKNKPERLGNLRDNFKHSNIRIIGMPEGKKEEQEIENLFESIMKENFPNLAKEIDFQEIQEAQSPKEVGSSKEEHTKAHHHYITQD